MVFVKLFRKILIMFFLHVEYINKLPFTYIPVNLDYILCQVLASYSTHRCINRAKALMVHHNYKVSWSFIGFKFSFQIMCRGGFTFSKELDISQPCSTLNAHIELHGYMSKG